MNRIFVGFTRNVNFLLEGRRLTARIPMPVEGTWSIRSAKQDKVSGDLLVEFKPAHNPLVESEVPPHRRHETASEIERRLQL